MKKITLLSAALMALCLTACSDEPIVDQTPEATIPGGIEGKYIGINFRNVDVSRALDNLEYQEGSANENDITAGQLHFLFFDMDGNPFIMKQDWNVNGTVTPEPSNWVKPVDITAGNAPDNSVTSAANAVLILGKPADEATVPEGAFKGSMPSRIVCIANVTDERIRQAYANKTIAQLLDYVTDPATAVAPIEQSLYNEEGNFIMTSATYWDGNDVICWSNISSENICANPALASANPVQIYVERLAAKVSVHSYPKDPRVKTAAHKDMEFQYYYVDPADNQVVASNDKRIMMEPIGWKVNNSGLQMFGIKHLLIENNNGTLFSKYFELPEDFNSNGRSFWATTSSREAIDDFVPNELTNPLGFNSYEKANTHDPFLQGNKSGVPSLIGKAQYARSFATKILFAARPHIVETTATEYEPGEGDQLMLWSGNYYTPEALCRTIERNNPGNKIVFCRTTEDLNNAEGKGHYTVQFYTLGPGSLTYNNRDITDPNTGRMITGMDVTPVNVPLAQYWNGMCYYVLNISNKIMATKSPKTEMFGVVRNTYYLYDLVEYVGLGTPIPTPDAPTRVENPTQSDSYVAAKLNILNWRLVAHDNVTLQ